MDFKDSRAKGNKTPWPVAQARYCFIMLIFWCSVCLERVFGNLSRKMQMVLLSCKTMQKDLKPIISSCKGIHQHKFLLATSIHSLLKEDITAWIKRDGFTEPGRWNGVFVGSSNLHPAVFILQGGAAQRKMTNKVLKTHDSCCNKKGFQKSCCTTLTGFLWSCFRPWFPSISKKKKLLQFCWTDFFHWCWPHGVFTRSNASSFNPLLWVFLLLCESFHHDDTPRMLQVKTMLETMLGMNNAIENYLDINWYWYIYIYTYGASFQIYDYMSNRKRILERTPSLSFWKPLLSRRTVSMIQDTTCLCTWAPWWSSSEGYVDMATNIPSQHSSNKLKHTTPSTPRRYASHLDIFFYYPVGYCMTMILKSVSIGWDTQNLPQYTEFIWIHDFHQGLHCLLIHIPPGPSSL